MNQENVKSKEGRYLIVQFKIAMGIPIKTQKVLSHCCGTVYFKYFKKNF